MKQTHDLANTAAVRESRPTMIIVSTAEAMGSSLTIDLGDGMAHLPPRCR